MIWSAEPDAVDGRVSDHLFDFVERSCFADAQRARESGSLFGVLTIGTPYATNAGVTHSDPGSYVKAGVEAAADEPNAKPLVCGHETSRVLSRKKIQKGSW